jgi:hypothetical protein
MSHPKHYIFTKLGLYTKHIGAFLSSVVLAVYVLCAMLLLNVANISFTETSDGIKDTRLLTNEIQKQ